MKTILKKIWETILMNLKMLWISTWYVWLVVLLSIIPCLIWGWHLMFWSIIGAVGLVTIYVFGRQIWWFISGTGDFQGRNGLLKRLWVKIFKNEN